MIPRVCEHCSANFSAIPGNVRKGYGRYCSRSCSAKAASASTSLKRGLRADELILSRADQSAGPDACWPWTGTKNADGYGIIRRQGRRHAASRMVYQVVCGDIPDGAVICHHCDNPACCNPKHLYAGSVAENSWDREFRNRGAALANGLTLEQAAEVIRLVDSGAHVPDVSRHFGLPLVLVYQIRLGRKWRAVRRRVAAIRRQPDEKADPHAPKPQRPGTFALAPTLPAMRGIAR